MLFIIFDIVMLYIYFIVLYILWVLLRVCNFLHNVSQSQHSRADKFRHDIQTYNTYRVDRRLLLPSHSLAWLQGLCSGWHTHTNTHTHADKQALAEMCGRKGERSFYLQQLLLINSKSFISPRVCVCVCEIVACSLLFYCATHMFAKHANCVSDVDSDWECDASLRSQQREFAN